MDGRTCKVFLATFLVASISLFAAWFAVDGLINLDELLEASGPNSGVGGVALRHYLRMLGLHGGTLLASIGLGSALVAVARAHRVVPIN